MVATVVVVVGRSVTLPHILSLAPPRGELSVESARGWSKFYGRQHIIKGNARQVSTLKVSPRKQRISFRNENEAKKREKKSIRFKSIETRDEESQIGKKNTIIPQISYYFCARAINKKKTIKALEQMKKEKKNEKSTCKTGNLVGVWARQRGREIGEIEKKWTRRIHRPTERKTNSGK